jgi:hypothetical protein
MGSATAVPAFEFGLDTPAYVSVDESGQPISGVQGFGADALLARGEVQPPKPSGDHSHRERRSPVPVTIGRHPDRQPTTACDDSPLPGFEPVGL